MVHPAETTPCSNCPWRKSNQGKRHSHGWFTKKNLRRLWTGLRTANAPGMTCHPTDPDNIVPEGCDDKPAPEGNEPVECAGALLMVQRELRKVQAEEKKYNTRKGLSRDGVMYWVGRCEPFAGTPLGGMPMTTIEEDEDIGFDG